MTTLSRYRATLSESSAFAAAGNVREARLCLEKALRLLAELDLELDHQTAEKQRLCLACGEEYPEPGHSLCEACLLELPASKVTTLLVAHGVAS